MIDDQIHDAGPDGLSDEEHDRLRMQLMATIRSGRAETTPTRPGRQGRALVVAGAVAAVIGTATVAAAYASLTRPDPKQAATIVEHAQVAAAAHNPGWRPPLDAESVDCDAPGDDVDFNAYASARPLAEAVEQSQLLETCVAKNREFDQVASDAAVVCARPEALITRPIVVLSDGGCASIDLEDFDREDLETLNQARAVEVALLAVDDPCPSRPQVLGWVDGQLDALGSDLALVDSRAEGSPPQVCFGTYVNWTAGTATVDVTSRND